MNTKQIVAFVAPPGAGKGTQADMLSRKFNFVHLESSKVIEDKFNNGDRNDPELVEAKKQWHSGELVNPQTVIKWMSEHIIKLANEGKSIVLSGSPRTLPEAEAEMPLIEQKFGRDNIKIFSIKISEEESIKRNSNRRVCKGNRHSIPNLPKYEELDKCPWDGSRIIKRALDIPKVIKERLKEYHNRTAPVIEYLKNNNYNIIEIKGHDSIDQVSQDILKHF